MKNKNSKLIFWSVIIVLALIAIILTFSKGSFINNSSKDKSSETEENKLLEASIDLLKELNITCGIESSLDKYNRKTSTIILNVMGSHINNASYSYKINKTKTEGLSLLYPSAFIVLYNKESNSDYYVVRILSSEKGININNSKEDVILLITSKGSTKINLQNFN